MSSFQSDKWLRRLLASLLASLLTAVETGDKCLSAARRSLARRERGDPASSPTAGPGFRAGTCGSHLHPRLCICSREGGGEGWNRCYLVVMITDQGEYETWKTEGEGKLQLILVKNNCFLLVSAEKISSRREAASGNSLLSSSGRKAR